VLRVSWRLAPGPGCSLQADRQENQGTDQLKAVGDAELDDRIDPPRHGLDLLIHALAHHLAELLDCIGTGHLLFRISHGSLPSMTAFSFDLSR